MTLSADQVAAELDRGIETLSLLPDPDTEGDAIKSLTVTLALVADTNFVLEQAQGPTAGLVEKLQEWVEKVFDTMKKIARQLRHHGQVSFSIGATGFVLSVSLTVGLAS